MNHTHLWTAATIIAFIVIVGFVLSVPHTRDSVRAPESSIATAVIPAVTLHDTFKKGVHTITGSLKAPNACTIVSATAAYDSSNTGSILVAISMPEDTGICLQVPAKMNFQTSVNAPANLPITATVNDVPATTTAS